MVTQDELNTAHACWRNYRIYAETFDLASFVQTRFRLANVKVVEPLKYGMREFVVCAAPDTVVRFTNSTSVLSAPALV